MSSSDPVAPRRSFRLRFSLLALLVFMTAACLLLAWLVQPRRCTATALFHIGSRQPVLLGEPVPFDAQEFDLLKQTLASYLESHFVAQAALRDPRIAALPIVASRDDPVQWILDNMEAEFPQDSEVMAIRVLGPAAAENDLRQIVDAVSKAFQEEVVFAEEQRRIQRRDALAKTQLKLVDELKAKMAALRDLKREVGEDDPEVRLDQIEIDTLTEACRQAGLQLETYDINALAPSRVRLIQPAVISIE